MKIDVGRETCGQLPISQGREWLVTNGTGSYASGTISGVATRGYHGLLVAALTPPVGRTLLVSDLVETVTYGGKSYPLDAIQWADSSVNPNGFVQIERFRRDGAIPVWDFACADALLEKRVWMQPGSDTTYVRYVVTRCSEPVTLSVKALVNYRDFHSRTRADGWRMQVDPVANGVRITAYAGATPFYVLASQGQAAIDNLWYRSFELSAERDRGLQDTEDHLLAATFAVTLQAGESVTFAASTQSGPSLDGAALLQARQSYEQDLLARFRAANPAASAPSWADDLVLAADQFIVRRPLAQDPDGKSIIAGYHWFADWGRDTMISLPGLTLSTGRPEIARSILTTFARFIDRGMLPNRFPDVDAPLTDEDYNTVDATLWYFEAIRHYVEATGDQGLLQDLFPRLEEIVAAHQQGTRFQIRVDPEDGLLYAGQPGVQLTWMDAKVGDWVVTPRIGKPVEVNALWYNALRAMAAFAGMVGKEAAPYESLAEATRQGFQRFWNDAAGCCFDVLDGPGGSDSTLRPNQIFAVSLPASPLTAEQQRRVVESCSRALLTSSGLRSLSPDDPQYKGYYGGDQTHRDGAYHQGTVWAWLIGPFVLAHLRVFQSKAEARRFLEPLSHHLWAAGLGTVSEIFDGDAPFEPKGCIAQAWSVAETLRAWLAAT